MGGGEWIWERGVDMKINRERSGYEGLDGGPEFVIPHKNSNSLLILDSTMYYFLIDENEIVVSIKYMGNPTQDLGFGRGC